MAEVISAEEGALRRGQQAVAEAKAGIDQRTRKVRGEIEQMRGFWSGAAAGSFTQLMQRWDAETVKLNNVLIELENALRGTEQDQAATEEEHQQTISGLGAMMGG
ncbi:MAG: WXG100 family type VII secretion target [Actinobacteria bacterium]|nr:WXG100 family type VII secretion target [Actinomycetota bacterium]